MMDSTFRLLLRGKGAHADPVAILADVPASAAGRTIDGYPHSIWQIVGHMNYWMNYELERIAGNRPDYPEHAIESWPSEVAPRDDAEWQAARENLAAQIARLSTLSESSATTLAAPVESMHVKEEPRSSSVEAVLWQIMVHNSYHVGQIAMLMRCFGLWPPRSGADTW
ncbi:MAG TPA: DinB family protein [Terriglobales bacterium]|nr:DinB family protein [Terriglobales bacterium]